MQTAHASTEVPVPSAEVRDPNVTNKLRVTGYRLTETASKRALFFIVLCTLYIVHCHFVLFFFFSGQLKSFFHSRPTPWIVEAWRSEYLSTVCV